MTHHGLCHFSQIRPTLLPSKAPNLTNHTLLSKESGDIMGHHPTAHQLSSTPGYHAILGIHLITSLCKRCNMAFIESIQAEEDHRNGLNWYFACVINFWSSSAEFVSFVSWPLIGRTVSKHLHKNEFQLRFPPLWWWFVFFKWESNDVVYEFVIYIYLLHMCVAECTENQESDLYLCCPVGLFQ